MANKDKHKPKVVPEAGDRQREIDRLEKDVEELRHMANSPGAEAELERIRQQVSELRHEFYSHLGAWQRAQIARHAQRPYTLDYISLLFTDFMELHGDCGRPGEVSRAAGGGRRSPEGPRHEGARDSEFRPAEAGGIS